MSTREQAHLMVDEMTEKQLQAFIEMFSSYKDWDDIEEIEPDEWDRALIKDSKEDNDESMPLDEFVKELGFDPNDLRI